jgi:hypothetical protein
LISLALHRGIEGPTHGPAKGIPLQVGTELPTPTGEIEADGVVVWRDAKSSWDRAARRGRYVDYGKG